MCYVGSGRRALRVGRRLLHQDAAALQAPAQEFDLPQRHRD